MGKFETQLRGAWKGISTGELGPGHSFSMIDSAWKNGPLVENYSNDAIDGKIAYRSMTVLDFDGHSVVAWQFDNDSSTPTKMTGHCDDDSLNVVGTMSSGREVRLVWRLTDSHTLSNEMHVDGLVVMQERLARVGSTTIAVVSAKAATTSRRAHANFYPPNTGTCNILTPINRSFACQRRQQPSCSIVTPSNRL